VHIKKATTRLYLGLPNSHLLHVYITVIRPVLEYCAPVWHYALTKAQSESLEAVQKRAIHITHNLTRGMPYSSMLFHVNLDSLAARREDIYVGVFRDIMDPASCLHSLLPSPRSTAITPRLRSSQSVPKVSTRTKRYCSFHGLRGSASPVLMATGFVNGRAILTPPPQNPHHSTDHQKFGASDQVGDPTAVQNLVQIRPRRGLLGEWVKYNENFICLYIFFRELTYRSDPSTDFYA